MKVEEPKHAWMDGEFVKWSEAKVHVLTHALHYGTAVFEGIRAYPSDSNLNVFRLKEHLERFFQSAKVYYLETKHTAEELSNAVLELLRLNSMKGKVYVRPLLYVGYGGIGLNFTGFPVRVAICAVSFENYFEKPWVKICTSSWRRISEQSTPPLAKASGNYINSVLAKIEALRDGYDEAVLLDHQGYVSEGSGENIFIVHDSKLHTPSVSSSILRGITRDTVMTLAREMDLEVVERNISRTELYTCDEAFFTGTAAEVTAICEVDRRMVGSGEPGVITQKIRKEYLDVVHGRNEDHIDWLTPVYRE